MESWTEAKSFADLGELAARFLEGEPLGFPGWGADDIDEETDDLVPILAHCCRGGFLTTASQPAGPARNGADGRPEERRAFVCGFLSEQGAARLRSLEGEHLAVWTQPASSDVGAPGPVVGRRGGEAFLFAGVGAGPEELRLFEEVVGSAAWDELSRASWGVVMDRTWNRDAHLWPALESAFGPPGTESPPKRAPA